MKKLKTISLLLSLLLLVSLAIPGTLATTTRAVGEQENSGMVISKTATNNSNGTYTIQLEAYATGDKVITETKKDVPTDIVLVLDQSGSMADGMNTYSFRAYSGMNNGDYYNLRHNGSRNANLYYPLEDGSYASVSVKRTQGEGAYNYTECPADWYNYNYYVNENNLYVKSGEEYRQVTLDRSGDIRSRVYTYTFPDDTTFVSNGSSTSPGNFNGKGPLYVLSIGEGEYTYEYTYTDKDGVPQTIGASTGANTVPDFTLYERYTSSSTTRLAALQTAVTNFADSVKTKAAGPDGDLSTTADNVNHRIAVVGFATGSTSSNDGYPTWENTEVFVGANQYNYNKNASSYYGSALQDMNTQAGYNNVIESKNALQARGATYPNYGLEMAKEILDANPVPQGQTRNRVVILFTDGSPGYSGYDNNVASSAVSTAKILKDKGVTVYSVGIFTGADASSAGIAQGSSSRQENQFMQSVSSNNGTPRSPSYYLSASDADTLNSIFQQISDQIETGGSSTTLDEEAVIKDIVAPAFTLPEGATTDNITLETYACTGKDANDNYTWSKNADAMGATAVIGSTNTADATTTDNQVSITGFDFAGNYVGTVTENGSVSYRGHKLVIKFNVTPRLGFFGGNGVVTNTSAGVYENASAADPILTFEQPTVDVPLKQPEVNVPDANVYLGAYYSQTVPQDAVKMGATVEIGGYSIDFGKAEDPDKPYGLEPWQVEYVNISISAATEGNGGSFEDIQEDITYTVTVTIAPKTQGSSGDQSAMDAGTGTIHVFKPRLTFKDSEVWYGGDAPSDFGSNLEEETWVNSDGTKKHDDLDVNMLNEKPDLSLTFTPETGKIMDGKVDTKQDIGVDVSVKIVESDVANHTTFLHTACDPVCAWSETTLDGSPAFLLHVNTCTLEIKKTGGAPDESYVFDVYKNGTKYSEVTIWGNGSETLCELPVGNYTIQENIGWSWRYSANNGGTAALTSECPTGSITCQNSPNGKIYWLNGFSQVVRNIFGVTD